jgi:hypothetical protein
MGDRFYEQQKNYKPKRRLKKDVIIEFQRLIGSKVEGLDRLTIKTLDDLTEAVNRALRGFTDE